jgi:DNA excision repair protein ERCC-2
MAVTLSKLFLRTISQNPHENMTGVSLWTLEDVKKAQAKQKEKAIVAEQEANRLDDEDKYWHEAVDEQMLMELDV